MFVQVVVSSPGAYYVTLELQEGRLFAASVRTIRDGESVDENGDESGLRSSFALRATADAGRESLNRPPFASPLSSAESTGKWGRTVNVP